GFISAAFAGQGMDGNLLSYGTDEENATWSAGYFGVILRSVTIDGWVVITILMIMAAISWVVMAAKARYINSVASANNRFLDRFEAGGSDVERLAQELSPQEASTLNRSILSRIVEAGMAELSRRSKASGGRPQLSTQAVATLRANLDRIATYEGQ